MSEEPPRPDDAVTPAGHEDLIPVVQAVVDLIEGSDAHTLEIESEGISVRVRRLTGPPPEAVSYPTAPPVQQASPREARREPAGHHQVRAPLTGIWYDSPAPGAAPYVQVGSQVELGTIIGLIETMKIFNEIASDVTGRVMQVYARRGDLVTAATPLISVDLSDTATAGPHRG